PRFSATCADQVPTSGAVGCSTSSSARSKGPGKKVQRLSHVGDVARLTPLSRLSRLSRLVRSQRPGALHPFTISRFEGLKTPACPGSQPQRGADSPTQPYPRKPARQSIVHFAQHRETVPRSS